MTESDAFLDRVRAACAHLPEVEDRLSHGSPGFFVRGKRSFAQLWNDGHHDDDFPHLWLAASDGVQGELVAADSETFFRPPYVGHRGWVGVRLDRGIGDDELAELLEDAYRTVAPATLVRELDRRQA